MWPPLPPSLTQTESSASPTSIASSPASKPLGSQLRSHAAREAASALRLEALALERSEAQASGLFTPSALTAPLRDLQDRFANLHTGLRKLSGAYRTDKKALGALLADAKEVKSGIAHLSDAIAWSDAVGKFEAAGIASGHLLGRCGRDGPPTGKQVDRYLGAAEEAITLSGDAVSRATVTYLASTTVDPAEAAVADSVRLELASWRASVASPPALAGRPELLVEPPAASVAWLSAHIAPMRSAAERIESVSVRTGRETHS